MSDLSTFGFPVAERQGYMKWIWFTGVCTNPESWSFDNLKHHHFYL